MTLWRKSLQSDRTHSSAFHRQRKCAHPSKILSCCFRSLPSEHVDQRAAPRRGGECALIKDSCYIFSFFIILEEQLTQNMNFYKINFSSQHLGVQGILDSDWSVGSILQSHFLSFEMYKTYIKYILNLMRFPTHSKKRFSNNVVYLKKKNSFNTMLGFPFIQLHCAKLTLKQLRFGSTQYFILKEQMILLV